MCCLPIESNHPLGLFELVSLQRRMHYCMQAVQCMPGLRPRPVGSPRPPAAFLCIASEMSGRTGRTLAEATAQVRAFVQGCYARHSFMHQGCGICIGCFVLCNRFGVLGPLLLSTTLGAVVACCQVEVTACVCVFL